MSRIMIYAGWYMSIKQVVKSGIVQGLLTNGNSILIVTPKDRKELEPFNKEGLAVVSCDMTKFGKLETWFFAFRNAVAKRSSSCFKLEMENSKGWIDKVVRVLPLGFLYRSHKFRDFLRTVDVKSFRDKIVEYRVPESVDCLFVLSAYDRYALPYLREAKQDGKPTVGYVWGWDNITTKFDLPFNFDKLLVWNNSFKGELTEIHGFNSENVVVTGAWQFDNHFKFKPPDREQFLRSVGLDPSKKLVLFALEGTFVVSRDTNIKIAKIIIDALNATNIPWQLLIRQHPPDCEDYSTLRMENVFIEDISVLPISEEKSVELLSLLSCSDVLINVCGTLILEACIFNVPVISPAFDMPNSSPYLNNIKLLHSQNHIDRAVYWEAVRIVHNWTELRDALELCLSSPRHNELNRRWFVESVCRWTDGTSGLRMAEELSKTR